MPTTAKRAKVVATSNLVECSQNDSIQRQHAKNKEEQVQKMKDCEEKGVSLRKIADDKLVQDKKVHAKEHARVEAEMLQGKTGFEARLLAIDGKSQAQAEKHREGQTATQAVIAEVGAAAGEEKEDEEEGETEEEAGATDAFRPAMLPDRVWRR